MARGWRRPTAKQRAQLLSKQAAGDAVQVEVDGVVDVDCATNLHSFQYVIASLPKQANCLGPYLQNHLFTKSSRGHVAVNTFHTGITYRGVVDAYMNEKKVVPQTIT